MTSPAKAGYLLQYSQRTVTHQQPERVQVRSISEPPESKGPAEPVRVTGLNTGFFTKVAEDHVQAPQCWWASLVHVCHVGYPFGGWEYPLGVDAA